MISRLKWFTGLPVFMLFLFVHSSLFAQEKEPVTFTFDTEHVNDSTAFLNIRATIAPGIKLYGLQMSDSDVLFSEVHLNPDLDDKLGGQPEFSGDLKEETDPLLESNVKYFTDSVTWHLPLKASDLDSFLVTGSLSYIYKEGDDFPAKEVNFDEFVLPERSESNVVAAATNLEGGVIEATVGNVSRLSIWNIFILGFLGGLLALVTPCIYSMIPITVSFFTKRSETAAQGIKNAVSYALSIIVIFTLTGFLITLIFGPAALNALSTNWIANLLFFAIFMIFGISFLGAFEITLPSSWSNSVTSKSGISSYWGIFLMALTLVIVSFSCTGPIIGGLLVMAATGSYMGPLVGMLGFSIALGLPFAFFAFFPSKLGVLSKAGGWQNAVKVTLGFLELALALKFLSNADLAKGWRLLDREVFIVLWVVIFALLGLYLIGKLKMNHDDELPKNDFGLPYVSITRLFLGIVSFAFALYMIPGLWGAPLKKISAFVPPMGTQDFILSQGSGGGSGMMAASDGNGNGESALPRPVKFIDRMKMYEPEVVVKYGMTTYFDYDEALKVAREQNKPLMLDFTGINCVNCREMEGKVWSDPEVMERLKNNFVIASLYVDVSNVYLPKEDQYYSDALKKTVKTIGDRSSDIQISQYKANTQPYYFFLDNEENKLMPEGYGYSPDVKKFKDMLDEVVEKYKKS